MWIAAAVFLIVTIGLPEELAGFDHFESHRRALWALLAAAIFIVRGCGRSAAACRPLQALALALAAWMAGVSVIGRDVWRETEVLATWLLPLFLLLAGCLLTDRDRRALGGGLALAGLLQVLLMLAQRWGVDPFYSSATSAMAYAPGRMIGTVGYQNQAMDTVTLAAALWIGRWAGWGLGMAAAAGLLAMLAGYRSGLAALLPATAAVACWRLAGGIGSIRWNRILPAVLVAGVLLAAAGIGLSPEWRARVGEWRDGARSPAVASRMRMARVALDMIREKPWTGWGAGEYAYQYLPRLAAVQPERKTRSVLLGTVYAREAHNDALQLTAEFGLAGLALALLLAAGLLRLAWRGRRVAPDAAATLVFIMLYFGLTGLFSFPWHYAVAGPLAGLLLGGCAASLGRAAEPVAGQTESRRCERTGSLIAAAAALALSVLFGWNTRLAMDEGRGILPPWAARYQAIEGARWAMDKRPGAKARALKHLEQARLRFRDVTLYNNLGNVYARLDRWPQALGIYREWVATGLDHRTALLNLSAACERLGDYREAARTLETMRDLFPDSSEGMIRRQAQLHFRAGDDAKAERVVERCRLRVEMNGGVLPADLENLSGAAALRQGKTELARTRFRRALERDPKLESARKNLERLEKMPPLRIE